MVDLENSLVTILAITFVKIGTVDPILSMLNNFYPNIQFTYETECNPLRANPTKCSNTFKQFVGKLLCSDGEKYAM